MTGGHWSCMKRTRQALLFGLLLGATIAVQPALAAADVAQPGTINYVEGQATIDGRILPGNVNGTARLEAGQVLATPNGHAEVLLTPGIFLRTDGGTAVQMVSPGLANTVVSLNKGRALVEVAAILHDNNVAINEN